MLEIPMRDYMHMLEANNCDGWKIIRRLRNIAAGNFRDINASGCVGAVLAPLDHGLWADIQPRTFAV